MCRSSRITQLRRVATPAPRYRPKGAQPWMLSAGRGNDAIRIPTLSCVGSHKIIAGAKGEAPSLPHRGGTRSRHTSCASRE